MNRELKFDLNVETNALLCPNPTEFYSKAYITPNVVDNFRTLPGVKAATKLANTTFTSILKASNCDFPATTESLDAIDIDVCPVSAMGEICRFDLEQSFVSLQMAKGSNADFTVPSFMAYYWDEMAKEVESEVEQIRWRGATTGVTTGATAFLSLCDGYNRKIQAASNVKVTGATSITTSNVIAEMTRVLNALPASLKAKRDVLRFHVSANVFTAFQLAVAAGNTQAFVTQALPSTFIGIKVVVNEGMSDNTMVLTAKDNLIYAFDGEGDSKALKAVNLEDTVAEPKLRTRANLKIGFQIVNPSEIVSYGI